MLRASIEDCLKLMGYSFDKDVVGQRNLQNYARQ